jgi:hypothetical protein
LPEQDVERLEEEDIRLQAALEHALSFNQQVAFGAHERFEAEAMLPALREALGGNATILRDPCHTYTVCV